MSEHAHKEAAVRTPRQKVFDTVRRLLSGRPMDHQENAAAVDRALLEFQREVAAKAEAESQQAKTMYEEGLLAVRAATAKVVEGYIEQVAALNIEVRQLREAAERAKT